MIRYVTIVCFLCFSLMAFATQGQVPPDSILILTNLDYVYPNWSPDGSYIVFNRIFLREDRTDIIVINISG